MDETPALIGGEIVPHPVTADTEAALARPVPAGVAQDVPAPALSPAVSGVIAEVPFDQGLALAVGELGRHSPGRRTLTLLIAVCPGTGTTPGWVLDWTPGATPRAGATVTPGRGSGRSSRPGRRPDGRPRAGIPGPIGRLSSLPRVTDRLQFLPGEPTAPLGHQLDRTGHFRILQVPGTGQAQDTGEIRHVVHAPAVAGQQTGEDPVPAFHQLGGLIPLPAAKEPRFIEQPVAVNPVPAVHHQGGPDRQVHQETQDALPVRGMSDIRLVGRVLKVQVGPQSGDAPGTGGGHPLPADEALARPPQGEAEIPIGVLSEAGQAVRGAHPVGALHLRARAGTAAQLPDQDAVVLGDVVPE